MKGKQLSLWRQRDSPPGRGRGSRGKPRGARGRSRGRGYGRGGWGRGRGRGQYRGHRSRSPAKNKRPTKMPKTAGTASHEKQNSGKHRHGTAPDSAGPSDRGSRSKRPRPPPPQETASSGTHATRDLKVVVANSSKAPPLLTIFSLLPVVCQACVPAVSQLLLGIASTNDNMNWLGAEDGGPTSPCAAAVCSLLRWNSDGLCELVTKLIEALNSGRQQVEGDGDCFFRALLQASTEKSDNNAVIALRRAFAGLYQKSTDMMHKSRAKILNKGTALVVSEVKNRGSGSQNWHSFREDQTLGWGDDSDISIALDKWSRRMTKALGRRPFAVVVMQHFNKQNVGSQPGPLYIPSTLCRIYTPQCPKATNYAPLGVVLGWLLLNEAAGATHMISKGVLFLNYNRFGYKNHWESSVPQWPPNQGQATH